MSIFDFVFDSDYAQRYDIEALRQLGQRTRRGLDRRNRIVDERIEQLEQELGEVTLLCRALLTALRESGALDPARLQAVMHEIDAADGVIDGRVTPERARPRRGPPAGEKKDSGAEEPGPKRAPRVPQRRSRLR